MFKPVASALMAAVMLMPPLTLMPISAAAHFQLLYTPQLLRDRGGPITLKLPFSHPASSGHVMEMPRPEAFYVVRRGKRTDLINNLEPMQWRSAQNTGAAWQARTVLRGLGDFVFVLRPAPYYEASEDKYIQQFTKTIVNVGSLPTGWDEALGPDQGLAVEILPLAKPYAIYAGGTFSGVVRAGGEPVPFAEIEVEFMNFPPDMQANAFAAEGLTTPPADAFITQTIHADANGTFTFGLPRAGFWGFAALNLVPDATHRGKPLSQDAVIWVQTQAMPESRQSR